MQLQHFVVLGLCSHFLLPLLFAASFAEQTVGLGHHLVDHLVDGSVNAISEFEDQALDLDPAFFRDREAWPAA